MDVLIPGFEHWLYNFHACSVSAGDNFQNLPYSQAATSALQECGLVMINLNYYYKSRLVSVLIP